MSTQQFPKAWSSTATETGRISASKQATAAIPVEAHWWDDLSEVSKEEYVLEHPNSKYAEMHKEAKEKPAPPEKPKAEDKPAAPTHDSKPEKAKSAAARESLKAPELAPKSTFRTHVAMYLKSRPKAIWGHIKHEGKEFKAAGAALVGLARGRKLTDQDKHALAAVAADLAIITATVVTGGHAAHGLAAFFAHGGTHLAQDCLIKAAVKGSVHHASVVSFVTVGGAGRTMDDILNDTIKLMADALESGDLSKYVDEADATAAPVEASVAKVTARIDMSAEVAGKGMCPECRKPMTVVNAGATRMWACVADRISFPVPNGHTD